MNKALQKNSRKLAAPSYVLPEKIPKNCVFLAEFVDEVSLCFFETKACLAYNEHDLPQSLLNLELSYHVHLPLDLPWDRPKIAWKTIETLVHKSIFLQPNCYVLHPQPNIAVKDIVYHFQQLNILPEQILLENTQHCNLYDIWPQIIENNLGVCLDLGHMLAYAQEKLLQLPKLWQRVRMLHAYAPDPHHISKHTTLSKLKNEEKELFLNILSQLSQDATILLEVFNKAEFIDSLHFFHTLEEQ